MKYVSHSTRVTGPGVQDLDRQMVSLSSPSAEPCFNDSIALDVLGRTVVRMAADKVVISTEW